MNAKDYGVAQNRDRVFMVSILGNYYYEFPKKTKLEKRLKDYLQSEVDEKYYLSDKLLTCFTDMTNRNGLVRGDRFNPHNIDESKYAFAITTLAGNRATDNFIKEKSMITNDGNVKRYLDSEKVDEFNIGDCADISFPNGYNKGNRVYKGYAPALNLTTTKDSFITKTEDLRIRKLTPLECWRLMGIDDEYFDKASQVNSNAQLYKQAGNGIVVDVFSKIVENMK